MAVEKFLRREPGNLYETMENFKTGIMGWNQMVFGHIFQRKKSCATRLLGIQKYLSSTISVSLEKLEIKFMGEYNAILTHEESYWQQKERMNWSTHGERNTRFFHASVLQRRRKGKIQQLRDNNGRWCTEESEIQQMVLEFYEKLYAKDPHLNWDTSSWTFPKLKRNYIWWLNRDVTAYDVKSVIAKLGAHKALGPDGIPASFLYRYWSWVG